VSLFIVKILIAVSEKLKLTLQAAGRIFPLRVVTDKYKVKIKTVLKIFQLFL